MIKSWMKYFVLALMLLAFASAVFSLGLEVSNSINSFASKSLLVGSVAMISAVIAMWGLCILVELAHQGFKRLRANHVPGTSKIEKVKTWLSKDGL